TKSAETKPQAQISPTPSRINCQADCCGTSPHIQVRGNNLGCAVHKSGGDVNAIQSPREHRWIRAVKPQNEISKPVLFRLMHRNENHSAADNVGEKLAENNFCRA